MQNNFFSYLLKWFFSAYRQQLIYRSIRDNPEKRPVSKRFGVISLILSTVGLTLLALLTYLSIIMIKSNNPILLIVGVLFLAGFVVSSLSIFVRALVHSVYQMKLNKKPIGWISLVVAILMLIIVAVVILYLTSTL